MTSKTSHFAAGKVALVTGGSRGIGAAIVRRLSEEGAKVAFTYSSSEETANALAKSVTECGGEVLPIRADSGNPEEVRGAVAQTVRDFGRLDILVNNAGILIRGRIEDYSLADFDLMFSINVRAVFIAAQSAASHMGEGGRIINIGSVVADRAGFPGSSVYAMTKAAVAALTRGLARDLGPRGITVNTIQPGPTLSEMSTPHEEMTKPLMPVGRLGETKEIASLAAYLVSPEAAFVNGAALTIDGGYLS